MATADEYAAWIVANASKKGTPEFETVAKAYELAKGEAAAPAEPKGRPIASFERGVSPEDAVAARALQRMQQAPEFSPGAQVGPKPSIGARLQEAFTGAARTTPEIEALPDIGKMPERNQFSIPGFKAAFGQIAASGPEELVQVIGANFPDVQARVDAKGNYILRSGIDGKEYAIKPGFQASDVAPAIGKAIPQIAASQITAPAAAALGLGKAAQLATALVTAGTVQVAAEGVSAAAGGTFEPAEIGKAIAGEAFGQGVGAAIGKGVSLAKGGVRAARQAMRGAAPQAAEQAIGQAIDVATPPAAQAAGVATEAGQIAPFRGGPVVAPGAQAEQLAASALGEAPAPTPPRQVMPLEGPQATRARYVEPAELAAKMEEASKPGLPGAKARSWLRDLANQDEEAMAAAQKLGVELPPDVYARQSQIREVAGLERSQKGSVASAVWRDTVKDAVDTLDKRLESLGAKFVPEGPAATQIADEVRTTLKSKIDELASQADTAYTQIRERVPQDARGSADDTLAFIRGRAKSRETRPGEAKAAPSAFEQKALQALTPTRKQVFDPMTMTATTKEIQPTYITLDDLRKEAGNGIKGQGPFKDEDVGVLKAIYARMTSDQERIASRYNTADLWKQAKDIVSKRKTLEDAAVAAFGTEMENSIAPALKNAVKGNPNDIQKVLPVLNAVPEQLRRDTFLTAIADASRATSGRGKGEFGTAQFQDVWRAMRRSKDFPQFAKALGVDVTKELDAVFKVSKVISQASNELTGTGASLQKVVNERNAASLLERMLTGGVARVLRKVPVAGAITEVAEEGLTNVRKRRIEATINVFNSQEMQDLMREIGKRGEPTLGTTRKFVTSQAFSRFAQESGIPRGIRQREAWIRGAISASRQYSGTEEQPTQ